MQKKWIWFEQFGLLIAIACIRVSLESFKHIVNLWSRIMFGPQRPLLFRYLIGVPHGIIAWTTLYIDILYTLKIISNYLFINFY